MAQAIYQFTASIPAGTAKTALYIALASVPIGVVNSVDLEVPPGPQGQMGFYLAMSGQQVIPFEAGQYIIWDDQDRSWELEAYPVTGAWSIVGYNLDAVNAHEVTARFHWSPLVATVSPVTVNVATVTPGPTEPILLG